MAEIHHELKMRASRDRIFQTLTDGVALERWHGAKVTGNKREWRLEYPDGTRFAGRSSSLTPAVSPGGVSKDRGRPLARKRHSRSRMRAIARRWSSLHMPAGRGRAAITANAIPDGPSCCISSGRRPKQSCSQPAGYTATRGRARECNRCHFDHDLTVMFDLEELHVRTAVSCHRPSAKPGRLRQPSTEFERLHSRHGSRWAIGPDQR